MTMTITEELAEELVGLPASIDGALRAHEKPLRQQGGGVICSNPDCDWAKPPGKNIKRCWHKHLVWAIHMAVKDWYING